GNQGITEGWRVRPTKEAKNPTARQRNDWLRAPSSRGNIVASTMGGSMADLTPQRKMANKLREHLGNIQQFEPEILKSLESVRHPNAIIREEIEHLAKLDANRIRGELREMQIEESLF